MRSILTFLLTIWGAAAAAGENTLWYANPATKWAAEALPVGNGDLGAMLFGGTNWERIQFNEKSLWTGDENDTGAYQAFGDVMVQLGHEGATNYRRELDLRRGVQRTGYECGGVRYERLTLASHPSGVIVLRLTADKPSAYTGRLWLSDMHDADILAEEGRLSSVGELNNGLRYEAQLRVLHDGGGVRVNCEPDFDNRPVPRRPRGPAVLDGAGDVYLSLKNSDRPNPAYHDTNDCDLNGGPLVLGGQWFDRGVSFGALSAFTFPAEGKYRWVSFHAAAGGKAAVQVWGDGKLLRELPASEKGEAPSYVCVPIDGVRKLKLAATSLDPSAKRKSCPILLGHLRLSPSKAEPARDPGLVRPVSKARLTGWSRPLPAVSVDFKGCNSLTLLLAAGTNYLPDGDKGWRGELPHRRVARLVDAAAATPFDSLLDAHAARFPVAVRTRGTESRRQRCGRRRVAHGSASGPVCQGSGRSGTGVALLPVWALPADRLLPARRAAGQSARRLERQQHARLAVRLSHRPQRADELLACRLRQSVGMCDAAVGLGAGRPRRTPPPDGAGVPRPRLDVAGREWRFRRLRTGRGWRRAAPGCAKTSTSTTSSPRTAST